MDQEKYDKELVEIKRLEKQDTSNMSDQELIWHEQAIKDAHWRLRMAMRTEDEVKRNICAP